jgi:hypothetical protein
MVVAYAASALTLSFAASFVKACFLPGEFVRANREKSNLRDWQRPLLATKTDDITTQSHSL